MTNEKMLSKLEELGMEVNKGLCHYAISEELMNLVKELKEDIRKETNVKKGEGKRDVLLKRIFKTNKNEEDRFYGFMPFKNQFVFTDGYRAVCLNDNYGFAAVKKPISEDSLKRWKPTAQETDVEIEIDLVDLKSFISIAKAEKKALHLQYLQSYQIDYIRDGKQETIYFNPQYLLEFCQMFHINKITVRGPLNSAYAEKDSEWGIIMPVRN